MIKTARQLKDLIRNLSKDVYKRQRQAELLLDLNLTSRNIPDVGRVTMCGIPAHSLEQYVDCLLYTSPEQLQSPQLTAEWEHRLKEIEHGEIAPASFMGGIAAMLNELVQTLSLIHICPLC